MVPTSIVKIESIFFFKVFDIVYILKGTRILTLYFDFFTFIPIAIPIEMMIGKLNRFHPSV